MGLTTMFTLQSGGTNENTTAKKVLSSLIKSNPVFGHDPIMLNILKSLLAGPNEFY